MANYIVEQYNNFISNSGLIYDYLSSNYLNRFDGAFFSNVLETIEPFGRMKFIKLYSYRKLDDDQKNRELCISEFTNALESFHVSGASVGLIIISYNGSIGVYYFSNEKATYGFDKYLPLAAHDVRWENRFVNEFIRTECSLCGGIVLGVPENKNSIINDIVSALENKNGYVAFLANPVNQVKNNKIVDELKQLDNLCYSLESVDRTIGTGSKNVIKERFRDVSVLSNYLKKSIEETEKNNNSLWEMTTWFATTSVELRNELGERIAGAYASDEYALKKAHVVFTDTNPLSANTFGIPQYFINGIGDVVSPTLRKSALTNYISSAKLASMLQIPTKSTNGFEVVSTNVNAENWSDFSLVSYNNDTGNTFKLGKISKTENDYIIPMNLLRNHVLITGAINSGKSNTSFKILTELYNYNIPFCVIESAKKEYWNLLSSVKDLKVYSVDSDGLDLKLNPLEPEIGTRIATHADDLMYAFLGAFDMEEPTKNAINELIKYTYEKFGFPLDSFAQPAEYPTVRDMFDLVDEYSKADLRYSAEVNSNVTGTMINRLSTLFSGTTGFVINHANGLTGELLCQNNCVVELDDLSMEIRPFISNIIIGKMDKHLRMQNHSDTLRNVIVLEEAHNIFKNVNEDISMKSKDIVSKYLSNLVSEIRKFGTGLIIIDQGASQINENAIANTGLKIIHNTSRETDVERVSYQMQLSEYQKSQIPFLSTGEAIINLRLPNGQDIRTNKVQIERAKLGRAESIACVFCNKRSNCCIDKINGLMKHDELELQAYSMELYSNRYNSTKLKVIIESMKTKYSIYSNEILCFVGALIKRYLIDSSEKETRRLLYFVKELL